MKTKSKQRTKKQMSLELAALSEQMHKTAMYLAKYSKANAVQLNGASAVVQTWAKDILLYKD
jgi:hypothetical protein